MFKAMDKIPRKQGKRVEGAAPEGGALCTRNPTKLWAGGGASSDGHSFLNLIIKQNNQPPLRYLISTKNNWIPEGLFQC